MIFSTGEKLVQLTQPDHNDDATRRFAPEKRHDLRLWNEFYSSAFPSRVQDAGDLCGSSGPIQRAPLQMAFIRPDNMIPQVSSADFYSTLRHTVLPGTLEGGPRRAHPQGSNGHGDFQPVFRIPVED
jgi:hypothetical protein